MNERIQKNEGMMKEFCEQMKETKQINKMK